MFVVIVSSWLKKIGPVVLSLEGVYEVKREGPRLYLYVDQDEPFGKVSRWLKKYITHYLTNVYAFEIFGIFNGLVDIIAYLPPEMKMADKYYQQKKKNLSQEEQDAFFDSHPELKK